MASKRKLEIDLFDGASELPWQEFFCALNTWFKMTAGVQRGLDENEAYIKERILGAGETRRERVVSAMVYSKPPESPHSFWQWISAIAKFVRRASPYWESGLLLGFASRKDVERLLSSAVEPAMVLKFSESRPGKLVISYVNFDQQPAAVEEEPREKIIEHILFDEEMEADFARQSIADYIRLSTKLRGIRRILPGDRSIDDIFEIGGVSSSSAGRSGAVGRARSDGYVYPGVDIVWK